MRKFLFCLTLITVFVGMAVGAMYADVKFQQSHVNMCSNGFNNIASCSRA